ncbi:MAG: 50S ribosomal protein L25 [Candidatus Marinimicrobia bacterium]|nr:50S ribosomal protein L25 [Candidatus Neomarinimicrobiota bacterium]
MEKIQLKAEKRDVFRKKLDKFRQEDKLPAVVYGSKQENTPIFVQLGEFLKAWRKAGESVIVELETEGGKIQTVIHDVNLNPLTHKPQHVDFYAVDLKKKITASVPLVFIGESSAVKTSGGVLVKVVHNIEVEGLPESLPKEIEVDISQLETFEDKILVKDLNLPGNVSIEADEEDVIALVEEPREEEVIEEGANTIDMSSIEATKEKKEEESTDEEGKDSSDKKDN